jgi:hypothetical protein
VAFALNLADRETLPEMHVTVILNPAIFGLDDHSQIFEFLTVAMKVTEPPDARTVFVAAPAWVKTRPPRQRARLTMPTAILRFIGTS